VTDNTSWIPLYGKNETNAQHKASKQHVPIQSPAAAQPRTKPISKKKITLFTRPAQKPREKI
jgi:hypothetical protein